MISKFDGFIRNVIYPWACENEKALIKAVRAFRQFIFIDPVSGIRLKYNLFIPKNYDAKKTYPLVLFMHDAGVLSTDPRVTLIQGLGGVIWATAPEQVKHECFVLAPQYTSPFANDESEAGPELKATVALVNHVVGRYSIDENRLYTTGQSLGCMASIAMLIKYPGLFAAALLIAGQWDATKMSVLTNTKMWIVVSEGDRKAFPGMNASMAALEAAGAKISRATWNGRAMKAEQDMNVSKMVLEGNNIKYTALAKGTVVPEGYCGRRRKKSRQYMADSLRD